MCVEGGGGGGGGRRSGVDVSAWLLFDQKHLSQPPEKISWLNQCTNPSAGCKYNRLLTAEAVNKTNWGMSREHRHSTLNLLALKINLADIVLAGKNVKFTYGRYSQD